jgi:K+/H+ antiporter YhaU regulatory subunit KhtT
LRRRFPTPWTAERIPGGYVVKDADGNALAYVYGRETKEQADTAKVLTMDEARRIANNIAKLPTLLGATEESELDFPEGGG